MKKLQEAAILIALLVGAPIMFGACSIGNGDEEDTGVDTVNCDADNEGAQRCEDNVVETCTGSAWDPISDCTATGNWCAVDENDGAACGFETALCDDAGEEEWICYEDFTITCNTATGEGDVFRTNCADATTGEPAECYNYGGEWGADCMSPDGEACFDPSLFVFLGCGDEGALDPNLACDQTLGCTQITSGFCSGGTSFSCDGDTLVVCEAPEFLNPLPVNVAYKCDDPTYGSGTCDPDGFEVGEAACVHETSGGLCLPGIIECGGSLTCNAATQQCE